ncbi:MAG: hypothetical protein F6K55_01590 [Moorea sp. SIO4A3]|nr:hypothetical protein [Moorena sp. SIO4A3]
MHIKAKGMLAIGNRCRVGSAYQNHCQLLNWYDALPTRPAIDVGWAVYIKAKGKRHASNRCRVGSADQTNCQLLNWYDALPTRPAIDVDVGWAVLSKTIVSFSMGMMHCPPED